MSSLPWQLNYQSPHLTLIKKENKCISQDVKSETYDPPLSPHHIYILGLLAYSHLTSALFFCLYFIYYFTIFKSLIGFTELKEKTNRFQFFSHTGSNKDVHDSFDSAPVISLCESAVCWVDAPSSANSARLWAAGLLLLSLWMNHPLFIRSWHKMIVLSHFFLAIKANALPFAHVSFQCRSGFSDPDLDHLHWVSGREEVRFQIRPLKKHKCFYV